MPTKPAAKPKPAPEKNAEKPKAATKKTVAIAPNEQPSARAALPPTEITEKIAPRALHEAGFVRTKQCRYGMMSYIKHDMYCGRSLDAYGEFSPGEADLFKQIIRPGSTVLDVGANIGIHTVLFAQLVGPQGRVFAFEPQRVIHQLLAGNVMMNGYLNVDARRAAVGSTPGTLLVPPVDYTSEGNYGSLYLGQWNYGEKVPLETIDSFNLPACHFIKADVEGMEIEVLKGARATILRHRPFLYIENDQPAKSPAVVDFLFGLNYRLYWHLSPYYTANNFYKNPENLFPDIVSVNLVCIPRESSTVMTGAREVQSRDENWQEIFLAKKQQPAPV